METFNYDEVMETVEYLILDYKSIKQQLLEFTDNFYDEMTYDIDGFFQANDLRELDKQDLEDLKVQVKSFNNILMGYKKLQYKFN